jgi:hypothetical protein
MLDQHWLSIPSGINEMTDNDLNVAVAAIACVRLKRLAPATVEQLGSGCHARIRRRFRLRHDAGQRPDAGRRMHSRERFQINYCLG